MTLPPIVDAVKQLGQRHSKSYGVKDEHYGFVAQALLWALENSAKESWSEETKDAWVAVYTIVQETMTTA